MADQIGESFREGSYVLFKLDDSLIAVAHAASNRGHLNVTAILNGCGTSTARSGSGNGTDALNNAIFLAVTAVTNELRIRQEHTFRKALGIESLRDFVG